MMKLTDEQLAQLTVLSKAIAEFDPEEVKRICDEQNERPLCLDCGGEYVMAHGDDPTSLCDSCAHSNVELFAPALAELRDLRELLATPMVCGFDTPRAGPSADPNVIGDVVGFDDDEYTRDEAIALGAAWLRAALKIPEEP